MDEIVAGLAQVQARALALAESVRAGQAALPEETEAADPSGVARVQVTGLGEPVGLSFADGWKDALAAGKLGAAVVAAAQAAAQARAEALRAAMEAEPQAEAPTPVAPPAPEYTELPTTSLEDLAEQALAATASLRSITASLAPARATGSSRGHEVTVELLGGQIVECTVDNRAASLSTYGLTMAAQEALGRARAEAAAQERPVRDPQLDGIFGEAMAHLNQMIRQSGVGGTDV